MKFREFTRGVLELTVAFILIVGAVKIMLYSNIKEELPKVPIKEYTKHEDSVENYIDSIKSLPNEQFDSSFSRLRNEYIRRHNSDSRQ